MSDVDFDILAKYSTNLEEMLKKNEAALDAHVRKVNALNVRLKVEYDLDAGGVTKKIEELYKQVAAIGAQQAKAQGAQSGMLAGTLTATQREADQIKGLLERTVKEVKTKNGSVVTTTNKTFDPATQNVTRTTVDKNGKVIQEVQTQKARENALKAQLNNQNFAGLSQQINRAQGAGDSVQQIQLLQQRKALLDQIVKDYADIAASPAYKQLVSGQERTQRRIETLQGGASGALEKQKERDLAKAERERIAREKRDEKQRKTVNESLDKQRQSEQGKQKKADGDARFQGARQGKSIDEIDYNKSRASLVASRSVANTQQEVLQINQRIATLDAARVQSLERSAEAFREIAREARKVGDFNTAGKATVLADNFERESKRVNSRVGGEKNKAYVEATKRSLEDELTTAKQKLTTELQILDTQMKQAKAIKEVAERNKEVKRILGERSAQLSGFQGAASGIAQRAGVRGFANIEKAAGGAAFVAGIDAKKAADAAALLGNATEVAGTKAKSSTKNFGGVVGTFFRWTIAARAVTTSMAALFALAEGATRVDRQFSVLRSIFRGTSEEAQQLKRDTLDLAIANGRTADEALSAATGFARLGLSRVQINKLVETSLVAANVAEIDSAQAAEKLTALMQQYKLSVDEVAQSLNRLNSISNTNNVTVSQLLGNIALTASVARQAGIALEDLEGIIGTTIAATKATSSEIGNAIKFVLQRIRKPENIEALKLEFDIDLTKANGDLREGTEIIAELARLYPLLTKQEQTRLLDLAAGTRQASRFAAVLENFNKAQLITANAIGDTNSAMRENEAITQSLASQIQSLETAWVQLGVAIGDSGVLDQVAEKVADLSDVVRKATELLNGGNSADFDPDGNRRTVNVANNQDRAALDKLADFASDDTLVDRKSFSEKELETFQKLLPLIEEYRAKEIEIETSGQRRNKITEQRVKNQKEFVEEARKLGAKSTRGVAARNLLELGGGEFNRIEAFINKNAGSSTIADGNAGLTAARGRVEQFIRGEKTSRDIADQIEEQAAKGLADPRRVKADFENLREVMRELPKGPENFNASLQRVNQAIDEGDYAAVAAEYRQIADAFASARPDADNNFLEIQKKQLEEINAQLDAAVTERNALASDASADDFANADEKVKNLTASLEEAKRVAGEIKVEVLTPSENAGVTRMLENMKERADKIREALESNTGGELTETANLQFARGASTNRVGVNNAVKTLQDTQAEAERVLAPLEKNTDEYRRQFDIQDELVNSAKTRVRLETEAADVIDQQNRNLYEGQRIRDAILRGKVDFDIADAGSGAGATGTDKLKEQIRGAVVTQNKARQDLINLGPDADPASRARPIATILTAQEAAQQRLIELRKREQQIQVEQRQSAIDMVRAEEERTKEVSKRLALASREEQLIAAFLQASINKGGPLTQDEFLGLSQRNRSIADQYNNANPFAGDDTPRGKNAQVQADLEKELREAREAIKAAAAAIESNQARIERWSSLGGPLADTGAGGAGNRALQESNVPDSKGSIILNAQGTVFNFSLASTTAELMKVFTTQVDARITKEMNTFREEFKAGNAREPNIAPAAAVGAP